MWRALAFLALLALAAFAAVWIADRPGTVTIVWNGYEIATSLAIALIGVLIAALVIGFLIAFTVRSCNQAPNSSNVSNTAPTVERSIIE